MLLTRSNLPVRIYELIKRRILANEFSSGMKLTEENLAKELGVSRTPIREAINRLVQDGLVTVSPGRGAFVATFSAADMVQLLNIREALEGMAARLASKRITKRTLARLRRHLQAGMAERERNGHTGYMEADREFHEAIAAACGNPHLCQLMVSLRDRIQMLRQRSVVLPGRAQKSFREHLQVIQALSLRDADLAEEQIRAHIRNVKEDLQTMANFQEVKNAVTRRSRHLMDGNVKNGSKSDLSYIPDTRKAGYRASRKVS